LKFYLKNVPVTTLQPYKKTFIPEFNHILLFILNCFSIVFRFQGISLIYQFIDISLLFLSLTTIIE